MAKNVIREKNVERYARTLNECARILLLCIGHSEEELIETEYLIPEAVIQPTIKTAK